MLILTPHQNYVFHGRDRSPSDALVVKETWVENVYRIHRSDFTDTNVLVDIGANIGAVSAYGLSLGAHVVSVEPDLDNLTYLTENMRVAASVSDKSYKILEVAATAEPGKVLIEPGHGHTRLVNRQTKSTVEVDGITLAQVFETAEIPYCDVLKVDIEGAEYPLIAATPNEVLRKARYITLEFDAAGLKKFGELVAKLACNFGIEILGSPERGGYIYARRYD